MIEGTNENFDQEVIASAVPVLVDFWAAWCGPCRAITPILNDLSNAANGKYKIVKVDVDTNPELSSKYQVSAIPTLLVFKNGEIVNRLVGLQSKTKLEEALA